MKKLLSTFLAAAILLQITPVIALDEVTTYKSVVKIQNYEYNSTSDTYSLSSLGSAVVVGTGLLLTNAHVIFDADGAGPSGFYEVCRTIDFMKKPVCFTTADLVAYDETEDLALLRFYQLGDLPITPIFQENRVNIGANLVMYGYPSIGGENITRTEGKVAGFEDSFYKIDGAIDHGNSGGGAFNKYGELVGVPSRVSSDNAVIGYMIPITTIHAFLAGKTREYTKKDMKAPKDFKEFIRTSQIGTRSKDIINDANIKTVSLKKYGLKFLDKSEGTKSFLYAMSMNNLGESSLNYGCFPIGGAWGLPEIDEKLMGESAKKYKIETTTITNPAGKKFRVQKYASLISKDNGDKVLVTDLSNSCEVSINDLSLDKYEKQIDKVIEFFTVGISVKKIFRPTTGFDTSTFRIGTIPTGVSIMEFPAYGGDDSYMLGYFSTLSNTGETFDMLSHRKKDTLDTYFLGSSSYYDDAPSDTTIKSDEYSFDSYKKIYEKEYSGDEYTNANFSLIETKNKKKVLIGTVDYKSTILKTNAKTYTYIVVAYPYMVTRAGKKEYHELTYSNSFDKSNTTTSAAIAGLKQFFIDFEPIGDTPF